MLGRDDVGALAPEMAADLALFDLRDLSYAGAQHDPLAALVMCQGPARARTVLVNGEIVVDDGALVGDSNFGAHLLSQSLEGGPSGIGQQYQRSESGKPSDGDGRFGPRTIDDDGDAAHGDVRWPESNRNPRLPRIFSNRYCA